MEPPPLPNSLPPPGLASRAAGRKLRRTKGALLICGLSLLLCFPLARMLGFIVPYKMPSDGMAPTLARGDHLFAEGFSYFFRSPRRGEIVVFKTTGLTVPVKATVFVKRVVGLPGESVSFRDGRLLINGSFVDLRNGSGVIKFQSPPGVVNMPFAPDGGTITVPEGNFYVVGDNTGNSFDSRFFGFVPRENIESRPLLRYWPPGRTGSIN